MIAKNSLTRSGFCSILEAPKILLLKFRFLYFQLLFLEIFLIPFLWLIFLLKFFLIYKFVFSQFLVSYLASVAVGLGCYFLPGNFPDCEIFASCENFTSCENSQPVKIHKSHCSSLVPFHLQSATNPSFPSPTINFPFFLN